MHTLIASGIVHVTAGVPVPQHRQIALPVLAYGRAFDRGGYEITSTTVKKANPELPMRAWVYLFESSSKRLVDAVLSDADGKYSFKNLPLREYDVMAVDPARVYRAVIANSLLPTLMT